jgi:hypothetical protein
MKVVVQNSVARQKRMVSSVCSFLGRGTHIRALTGFWDPLGSIGEANRMILVLSRFEEVVKP